MEEPLEWELEHVVGTQDAKEGGPRNAVGTRDYTLSFKERRKNKNLADNSASKAAPPDGPIAPLSIPSPYLSLLARTGGQLSKPLSG